MAFRFTAAALGMVLLIGGAASASEAGDDPSEATEAGPDAGSDGGLMLPGVADADYRLGVGDVVALSVYREADLNGDHLVTAACEVTIPMVGAVPACGLTVSELSAELRLRLGACCLVNPYLTLSVKTFGSRRVQLLGQISRRGAVVLSGETSLLELINLGGGPKAENVVDVEHFSASTGVTTVYSLRENDLLASINVADGDVVTLKSGRSVYLEGEVAKPGAVPFREGLTAAKAIAMAGGVGDFGAARRVRVLKADGSRVKVNVRKVNKGRQVDLKLDPDDRVLVPKSVF